MLKSGRDLICVRKSIQNSPFTLTFEGLEDHIVAKNSYI